MQEKQSKAKAFLKKKYQEDKQKSFAQKNLNKKCLMVDNQRNDENPCKFNVTRTKI